MEHMRTLPAVGYHFYKRGGVVVLQSRTLSVLVDVAEVWILLVSKVLESKLCSLSFIFRQGHLFLVLSS